VRLLLGGSEAASAPALLIITGMWYKRTEQLSVSGSDGYARSQSSRYSHIKTNVCVEE
jgi:hypothetical protein